MSPGTRPAPRFDLARTHSHVADCGKSVFTPQHTRKSHCQRGRVCERVCCGPCYVAVMVGCTRLWFGELPSFLTHHFPAEKCRQ